MYNDSTIMPGEAIGETYPQATGETEPNANAEQWAEAMGDVDEFQGEWSYGEPQTFSFTEVADLSAPETLEQDTSPDQALSGAGRLTSYGFDTVCRVYDLNTVLNAIDQTDVTSGEAVFNPVGKIYETIEPRPESRAYLFREIQKDLVANSENNNDPHLNTAHSPLGMTPYGEMYDKRLLQDNNSEQTSLDAILALKHLLNALKTDPRFKTLQQRAAAEGKEPADLLVSNTINPTITTFLNGINGEMSGGSVEEILDEIAEDETNQPESDSADSGNSPDGSANGANDQELVTVLDNVANETAEPDAADFVLGKFNQSVTPAANPSEKLVTETDDALFSDDDFQNILADEDGHLRHTSELDPSEVAAHLENSPSSAPLVAGPAHPANVPPPPPTSDPIRFF